MKLTKNGELYCHFTNTPKEFCRKPSLSGHSKSLWRVTHIFHFVPKFKKILSSSILVNSVFLGLPLQHPLVTTLGRVWGACLGSLALINLLWSSNSFKSRKGKLAFRELPFSKILISKYSYFLQHF